MSEQSFPIPDWSTVPPLDTDPERDGEAWDPADTWPRQRRTRIRIDTPEDLARREQALREMDQTVAREAADLGEQRADLEAEWVQLRQERGQLAQERVQLRQGWKALWTVLLMVLAFFVLLLLEAGGAR